MGLFDRRIRPAFISPPAEAPKPAVRDRLNALRLTPPWQRNSSWWRLVDDLLDDWPTAPGRVDAIADNYRENP